MRRSGVVPLSLLWLGVGGLAGFVFGTRVLPALDPEPTATPSPMATATATTSPSATATVTPSATLTATASSTVTATLTATDTPTPAGTATITLTPSATPTYKPIAAAVLEQSNCRYGPGAAYLYEWGLYPGVRVDIVGRNDLGTWAYVHPWTYFDRCWVRADYLEIRGDLAEAPPYYSRLPFGELYLPPTNPRASRIRDQVTIAWDPVWMTTDDDRGYLIEAWLCQDGQLVFTPLGTHQYQQTTITVSDQAGCTEPSGARLYTAEKHGYTQWVKIPWPPYEATPLPSP